MRSNTVCYNKNDMAKNTTDYYSQTVQKIYSVFEYMQKIPHISTYANKFMHNFGKNVKIFLIKHCEKLLFAAFLQNIGFGMRICFNYIK